MINEKSGSPMAKVTQVSSMETGNLVRQYWDYCTFQFSVQHTNCSLLIKNGLKQLPEEVCASHTKRVGENKKFYNSSSSQTRCSLVLL